jgi:uncharacterized membrane protein YbaN (DUF454 family)
MKHMRRKLHKAGLYAAGGTFIGIGTAGVILPLLPGIPFLALGIYFLYLASRWIESKIEMLKIKYPLFGIHFDRLDKKLSKFFKKAY